MKLNCPCPVLVATLVGIASLATGQSTPGPSAAGRANLFEAGSTRADSGPAQFGLKGVDAYRGEFSGTLAVSRRAAGALQVVWEARFAEGPSRLIRGDAQVEGDTLRVQVTTRQGVVQALRGQRGEEPVGELLFEIQSDRLGWKLEHWENGKLRARGQGETSLR